MHRITFVLLIIVLIVGCAATTKITNDEKPEQKKSLTDTSQQGNMNTAIQFVKNESLPLGLALLLGFDKWLSHRREMMRLKAAVKSGD